jgi:hypothetical protein
MLIKEWSWNLFEILCQMQYVFFLIVYSKGGTHVIAFEGKIFHVDFKFDLKVSGPELFTPIVSNKNM